VRQVAVEKSRFGVLQRRLRGIVVESRAPDEAPLSRELQLPGRLPCDAQQMTSTPRVRIPPAGQHGFPYGSSSLDLAGLGYSEQEYLISGTAHHSGS
jgi:Alpha/beta hydrolase domain